MELTEKNIKNFWKKVEIKSEDICWEWTACKNKKGYGQFRIDKKIYSSHRISYILANGQIPEDDSFYKTLFVCHSCDNPSCVNPNHLFLGTCKDNSEDKVSKNRQLKGIKHGLHKLTEQEVLEIRFKWGTGFYTQKQLSEEYGVSQMQISFIVNIKQWRHI